MWCHIFWWHDVLLVLWQHCLTAASIFRWKRELRERLIPQHQLQILLTVFTPTESKSAKISTRRESERQIKKVVILNFLILWSSLKHMGGHFKVQEATWWWVLLLWWSSWVIWSHCSLNGRRRTVSHSTRQHYPSCPPAWAARYVTTELFKFFTKRGPLLILLVVWEFDTFPFGCQEAWYFKYSELSCMLGITPLLAVPVIVCWCCHRFSPFW